MDGSAIGRVVASWLLPPMLAWNCRALHYCCDAQISKALLNDDSRLRLPRFLEDDTPKDPEATKQDLIDKIAQLNASIDEVAAQLKSKDVPEAETAEVSLS
jgi:hypothetical protein